MKGFTLNDLVNLKVILTMNIDRKKDAQEILGDRPASVEIFQRDINESQDLINKIDNILNQQ
tara:strand:+ start:495 stop:680 length:186 start_codon:yes stop_codon:yes gene_type:complete